MKISMLDYVPENDDRWAMVAAMERYFSKRYPQNRAMIEEMCGTLIAALCLTCPNGAGGVGLLKGWEERLDNIVKNNFGAPAAMSRANEHGTERP